MNKRQSVLAAVGIAAVLAIGQGVADAASVTTCATTPGQVIAHVNLTTDVQITGTTSAPQTLMTTVPACFDGGPTVVEFDASYLNHLPAAGTQLNGIGFDLVIDGVRMERMSMAGTHSTNNDFWPINLRDYLDSSPRLIPAGTHTVGIVVWRWSPNQDGYLTSAAGYVTGWGMPIRLTVIDM
jgi:hypothetical protein